jgi:hypothetical protein
LKFGVTQKNSHIELFNPDYAVGIVTRVEKPQRNEKLERFCAEDIVVHMLRSKIVKSRQGRTARFFRSQ